MSDALTVQMSATAKFRALHEAGCFVLPNPWDIGTARYLQHLGFQALATTSAGFAFSRGLTDEVSVIPRELVLAHLREIAGATPLPVNADFQNGYAHAPEDVAESVRLCIATGVAGLSIEDATGEDGEALYERSLAIERIRAARAAIDASGIPVVLTARCEAFLVGQPEPLATSIDRLVAYAEAGADCLYAPRAQTLAEIAAIVQAVAPKPVNVLAVAPNADFTLSRLGELGVRRVSVGATLARVAWGAFIKAASSIAETGSFDALADAVPFSELNAVFEAGR